MTDLDIAAYVDRGLSADRSEAFEEHLSQCASCRDNVIKTQQILARPTAASRFARSALIVLAAAVVLVVALPSLRTERAPTVTMRGDTPPATLLAYGPLGEVQSSAIRFTWGSVKDGLSYHLSVKRDDGTEIWQASLTDTTVALPQTVSLKAGQRYVWIVDAISSDGVTRSTGSHEFGIGP